MCLHVEGDEHIVLKNKNKTLVHNINVNHEGLKALRHTAAHVLAQAVKKLFPNVKLAIGPATDTGFYYDFDIGRRFSDDDLQTVAREV